MFLWKLSNLKQRPELNDFPVVIKEDKDGDERVSVELTHEGATLNIRVRRSSLVSTQTNTSYQDYNDALQQTKNSVDPRLRMFAKQLSEKSFEEAQKTAKGYTLGSNIF